MAKRPSQSENEIQRGIVAYLRATLINAQVFAVPNRAPRTRSGRASNATPGLLPGVPDLMIIVPGGRCYFIEVKTLKGTTSEHQDRFLSWCAISSVPYAIARSIDDARTAVAAWRLDSREAKP